MTKKNLKSLAIDLSIGKVKICLLTFNTEDKSIGGGWSSLPVNFEYKKEKEYEFTKSLSIAIEAFLAHHKTNPDEIDSVVFCTGGSYYMFKNFSEGLIYSASIIKMIFPRQKVYFIRCDSELINIDDVFDLEPDEASAYGCTNFLGTSILAAKTFSDGLAIDMGTISTSIIPILNGHIDPLSTYNPKGYTHHRYSTGKHVWYGAMHTPLNYITTQAKTQRNNYNLILRSCSTSTLISLLNLMDRNVVNSHVVNEESKISDREMDFIYMAETVGLDTNTISRDELLELAADIYQQYVLKISDIIRNILTNMNYRNFNDLKVMAAGLGQDIFIVPALLNCGFDETQIITVTEDSSSNLWTATSVYGLAILGLERLTGEKIDVSIDSISS